MWPLLLAAAACVLVAAAPDPTRPVVVTAVGAVVTAALLVLVMITALDRAERTEHGWVTVLRAPAPRRLGAPALAVGAAALVSVTAAQHVVPSVGLVLVGIAAAVAALAVANRAHRNQVGPPDVPK